MALSKGAIISLILKYIGGQMLMRMEATKVAGAPVAVEAGLGSFGSLALARLQGLQDAILSGDIMGALDLLTTNPVEAFLGDIQADIGSLAAGDFSLLESVLPAELTSDPLFADSLNLFKSALAGEDGAGGAFLAVNLALEHTARLAGTTPSSDDVDASVQVEQGAA